MIIVAKFKNAGTLKVEILIHANLAISTKTQYIYIHNNILMECTITIVYSVNIIIHCVLLGKYIEGLA